MTHRRRFSAAILIVLAVAVLTVIVLTTLVPKSGAVSSSKIAARVLNETAQSSRCSSAAAFLIRHSGSST